MKVSINVLVSIALLLFFMPHTHASTTYYVDSVGGLDSNNGTIGQPFQTFQKALDVVSVNVSNGKLGDDIVLRGGTYRNDNFEGSGNDFVLYNMNIKGTATDKSVIQAMGCLAGAPGCVQRKTGGWYEDVVFDDSYTLTGTWTIHSGNIWKVTEGYLSLNWGTVGSPGKGTSWQVGANDSTLAIGPRLLLQDGVPSFYRPPWGPYDPINDAYQASPTVDITGSITAEGQHTYDQATGILYYWPYSGTDPNTVVMQSWKGSNTGVRQRSMIRGDIEHAEFRGIKWQFFTQFMRENTSGVVGNYRNILWVDNEFRYGWKHFLLDHSSVVLADPEVNNWVMRDNVFFRPSRECFQPYGVGNIFESNDIVEHNGLWTGPTAIASAINGRHSVNMIIRDNYLQHIGTNWVAGNMIMFEWKDAEGDGSNECIWGGGTIENNTFNLGGGTAIYTCKSGCRVGNMSIQNNVFEANTGTGIQFSVGNGVLITSPHNNLRIAHNTFNNVKFPVRVQDDAGTILLESKPNTIEIKNNIFVNGSGTTNIHARLVPESIIDTNLFFNNVGPNVGSSTVLSDPLFTDVPTFDFSLTTSSPVKNVGLVLSPIRTHDRLGHPVNGLPDLGALEFYSPLDKTPGGTGSADTESMVFTNVQNESVSIGSL